MFRKVLRWIAGRLGGTPAVQRFDDRGADALADTAKEAANRALDAYKPQAVSAVMAWADRMATTGAAITRAEVEADIQDVLGKLPAVYATPIGLAAALALQAIPEAEFTQIRAKGVAGIYQIALVIEIAIDGARF